MTETHKIVFTDAASDDVDRLYEWICENDHPKRALDVIHSIESTIQQLKTYPQRGVKPRESSIGGRDEIREIRFKPYRMIYKVRKSEVLILLVADGRRNLHELLEQRLRHDNHSTK